jgi:heptaprenyl diphosphate synthase
MNKTQFSRNQKHVWLAMLIATGLVIFMFEIYIPRPLPWMKPGLANIASLLALYMFGVQAAFIVFISRAVIGSLVLGTLLNPVFILSIGGGIAAASVMAFTKRFGEKFFSIFGVSILGAVVHNVVQLILVAVIIIHQTEIFYLLPAMLVSGLFTGIIVALISYYLLMNIKKHFIDF